VKRYIVERSVETDRDLEAVFDFLVESYVKLGEAPNLALGRAGERVEAIEAQMLELGRVPHQGTRVDNILPGLRCVTKDKAIFYFDVDDDARRVRVTAIFFGGQDHRRRMLQRLL
jgi:plasmid stabilization system protein ParE